jgi:hypothetical protein
MKKSLREIQNPFSLQFGVLPRNFVGRGAIIDGFVNALDFPTRVERTTIITGLRGAGKTAILSDVSNVLSGNKKVVTIKIAVQTGMLAEILNEANKKGKRFLGSSHKNIQGVSVGALGFSFSISVSGDTKVQSFRGFFEDMLTKFKSQNATLVILMDEVHNDTPELREFVTAYQHMITDELPIAVLMAGLPRTVSDVLNDKVMTFLRRANRIFLESIKIDEIRESYKTIFDELGIDFSGNALPAFSDATKGYPYLYQLLGYYLFDYFQKNTDKRKVNKLLVEKCLGYAKDALFRNVLDIVWKEMSEKDRDFAIAMSEDDEVSSFGDILSRMDVKKNYASNYRDRLIEAGVVKSAGHGKLIFVAPYFREYIFEKIAE